MESANLKLIYTVTIWYRVCPTLFRPGLTLTFEQEYRELYKFK